MLGALMGKRKDIFRVTYLLERRVEGKKHKLAYQSHDFRI